MVYKTYIIIPQRFAVVTGVGRKSRDSQLTHIHFANRNVFLRFFAVSTCVVFLYLQCILMPLLPILLPTGVIMFLACPSACMCAYMGVRTYVRPCICACPAEAFFSWLAIDF